MKRPWVSASMWGGLPEAVSYPSTKKKVSHARAQASALYFFLSSSMYFLLRVLTGHVVPFEGELVPQERGPVTLNPGNWYPKLSSRSDFAAFDGECSSNRARAPLCSRRERSRYVLDPGLRTPRWPSPSRAYGPWAGRQLQRRTKPVAVVHA